MLIDIVSYEWYYNGSLWHAFAPAEIGPTTNTTLGLAKGSNYIDFVVGLGTVKDLAIAGKNISSHVSATGNDLYNYRLWKFDDKNANFKLVQRTTMMRPHE